MSNVGKTLSEATGVAVNDYISFNSKTWKIYKVTALGLTKGFKAEEHNNDDNKIVLIGNRLSQATVVDAP